MTPMLQVSPLSPERVCASWESGTFMAGLTGYSRTECKLGFLLHHFHARDDLFARHERRPVGHDLAHHGAPFAEASGAGRAVEHQRNQFAGEAVHGLLVRPALSLIHI